jgi:divalent metal cation (Fe/Co/Zn/Cd) transporter
MPTIRSDMDEKIYFWSFVVSLLIFALGAGFAIYEGFSRILEPVPIESPVVSYVVFALAFVFEGGSWLVSLRQFSDVKGEMGFIGAIKQQGSAIIYDAVRR